MIKDTSIVKGIRSIKKSNGMGFPQINNSPKLGMTGGIYDTTNNISNLWNSNSNLRQTD